MRYWNISVVEGSAKCTKDEKHFQGSLPQLERPYKDMEKAVRRMKKKIKGRGRGYH